MKLLFDTQAFVWWCLGIPKISNEACNQLDLADEVFLSPVTLWEIGLKASGKGFDFHLPDDWEKVLPAHAERHRINWLPISPGHCRRIQDLPFHHKDPYDRMIVAQALSEGLKVVSSDPMFDDYGVERVW